MTTVKTRYKVYHKKTGRYLGLGFGHTKREALREWRKVAFESRVCYDSDLVVKEQ